MIDTKDVICFFDELAPKWDAMEVRDDAIIDTILFNAGVRPGIDVLDVACGTGILFRDYLKRDVATVTAVDISPKMAEIARQKAAGDTRIHVICADVEKESSLGKFDSIVVYNAFPHFPDPHRLIRTLSGMLNPDGYLTIAHGMSREKIDAHHNGPAKHVSNGLMEAEALAEIFGKYLEATTCISNDQMYQVVGRSRCYL